MLVLGTYRDDEIGQPLEDTRSELQRLRHCQRLLLPGMADDEVRALLAALGAGELPEMWARAIVRQTEGNPFFVEEMLRGLIEPACS